jgi:hypothetical protein
MIRDFTSCTAEFGGSATRLCYTEGGQEICGDPVPAELAEIYLRGYCAEYPLTVWYLKTEEGSDGTVQQTVRAG